MGDNPKAFDKELIYSVMKTEYLLGLDLPVVPSGSMHVATAALYYFQKICASHTGNNPQYVGTTAIVKVSDKYLPIRYDDYS